jgi:hypothetical protein
LKASDDTQCINDLGSQKINIVSCNYLGTFFIGNLNLKKSSYIEENNLSATLFTLYNLIAIGIRLPTLPSNRICI